MYGKVIKLTPQKAREFLACSKGNRAFRKMRITKYAADVTAGRFYLTPHGMCFDVDGRFVDGHHRCKAVIEANKSVMAFVVYDVPIEVLPFLDQGMPRSAKDALSMAGLGEYSASLITAARSLDIFPQTAAQHKLSDPEEYLVQIERHSEALTFACSRFRANNVGMSRGVRCLIARAYYHADIDRLAEFCEILRSGVITDPDRDTAAVVFRNLLFAKTKLGTGHSVELERYRKGQSCLHAFLQGKRMTRCYGTESDLFPLPQS